MKFSHADDSDMVMASTDDLDFMSEGEDDNLVDGADIDAMLLSIGNMASPTAGVV